MSVSVQDVRTYLNDLPSDKISDTVVQQKINFAISKVNSIKKSSATDNDLDNATIALAGFYAYQVYADQYRNLSSMTFNNGYATPADGSSLDMAIAISISDKLANLKQTAEEFVGIVTDIKILTGPNGLPIKIFTAYIDGSMTNEYIARFNNTARLWLGV